MAIQISNLYLNATKVSLHPGADTVVCVRQLESRSIVVVEGLDPPSHACEVLQTSSRG